MRDGVICIKISLAGHKPRISPVTDSEQAIARDCDDNVEWNDMASQGHNKSIILIAWVWSESFDSVQFLWLSLHSYACVAFLGMDE